jgi:hypothetical protein
MHEAGLRAFAERDTGNSRRYSFEEKPSRLDPGSARAFRAGPQAWRFFQAQAPWYQRTSIFWVTAGQRVSGTGAFMRHPPSAGNWLPGLLLVVIGACTGRVAGPERSEVTPVPASRDSAYVRARRAQEACMSRLRFKFRGTGSVRRCYRRAAGFRRRDERQGAEGLRAGAEPGTGANHRSDRPSTSDPMRRDLTRAGAYLRLEYTRASWAC